MSENLSENLEAIPIIELFGKQFIVPSYQRGYRWTERQVTDLLDDLLSFYQNSEGNTSYCLQPVVVKKSISPDYPDHWEVIDGQQRLTTLYIIIKYLAEFRGRTTDEKFIDAYGELLYSIDYQTRPGSKGFLKDIITSNENNTYPDYFYMGKAFRTVESWCKKLKGDFRDELLNLITRGDDNHKHPKCKVIWYEVEAQEDGPKLFSRLNVGKIPLTNAELIKALFLSRADKDGDKKDRKDGEYLCESLKGEIALLWDEMEQQLRDKDFWAFITNEKEESYPNRIELLFDLIAKEQSSDKQSSNDEFFTFQYFLDELEGKDTDGKEKEKKSLWKLWLEIEEYYLTLREWYCHDRDLYHQIGYLVNVTEDSGKKELKALLEESRKKTKDEFREHIVGKIKASLGSDQLILEKLKYGTNNKLIEKILLLFNVESIRQNQNSEERYPFKSSKADGWTLEHIHAQNSVGLKQNDSDVWRRWTEEHKKALEKLIKHLDSKSTRDTESEERLKKAKGLLDEAEKFYKSPKTSKEMSYETFEKLFDKIIDFFTDPKDKSDEDYVNGIANLALLKAGDNTKFSNSAFETKRQKMLELDKDGSYIPICTRRVFLKYYSEDTSGTQVYFWGQKDRESYLKKIKSVLSQYLPPQNSKEDKL